MKDVQRTYVFDLDDWTKAPVSKQVLELVGPESWECAGKKFTREMRGQVLRRIGTIYETGLQWRLEDYGDSATLADFLQEESFEDVVENPYRKQPFRVEHGDNVVDWVADFLYLVWGVERKGEIDHNSVMTALSMLDNWYEGLLIKHVLAVTANDIEE